MACVIALPRADVKNRFRVDERPADRAVAALLSDFFPRTTGEIVHVDGGVHLTGA
jgi:enoyl-[acyl-carrier-protein] reductase (NADH)